MDNRTRARVLTGGRRLLDTCGVDVLRGKSGNNLALDASSQRVVGVGGVETRERQNRDCPIERGQRSRFGQNFGRTARVSLEKSIQENGCANNDCTEDDGAIHKT